MSEAIITSNAASRFETRRSTLSDERIRLQCRNAALLSLHGRFHLYTIVSFCDAQFELQRHMSLRAVQHSAAELILGARRRDVSDIIGLVGVCKINMALSKSYCKKAMLCSCVTSAHQSDQGLSEAPDSFMTRFFVGAAERLS